MTPSQRPGASLALMPTSSDDAPLAATLARQLDLPLADIGTDPGECGEFDLLLLVSASDLALQLTRRGLDGGSAAAAGGKTRRRPAGQVLPGPVRVDFGTDDMRHRRRSGHNELLGRAVGVSAKRSLHIVDATAGLGRDSFVLADMGCNVTLCEREPVIAAMLLRGVLAAQASGDDWLVRAARGMSVVATDARELAPQRLAATDVIYLDPMFPPRDKSAAVKKEMALFHILLGSVSTDRDADALLLWAIEQDVPRVVAKRPPRAPFLAGRKPSHSVSGKAVRFDVYVRRALA
jgi:16S rRNA (guanine1516-N2)-methyltransferase